MHPWGPFNTHLLAEIYDVSGSKIAVIELNSYEGDQIEFKRIHPELVAKGERCYSLDLLGPDGTVRRDGHALVQFFDGRPSYDTVRDLIFKIAEAVSR